MMDSLPSSTRTIPGVRRAEYDPTLTDIATDARLMEQRGNTAAVKRLAKTYVAAANTLAAKGPDHADSVLRLATQHCDYIKGLEHATVSVMVNGMDKAGSPHEAASAALTAASRLERYTPLSRPGVGIEPPPQNEADEKRTLAIRLQKQWPEVLDRALALPGTTRQLGLLTKGVRYSLTAPAAVRALLDVAGKDPARVNPEIAALPSWEALPLWQRAAEVRDITPVEGRAIAGRWANAAAALSHHDLHALTTGKRRVLHSPSRGGWLEPAVNQFMSYRLPSYFKWLNREFPRPLQGAEPQAHALVRRFDALVGLVGMTPPGSTAEARVLPYVQQMARRAIKTHWQIGSVAVANCLEEHGPGRSGLAAALGGLTPLRRDNLNHPVGPKGYSAPGRGVGPS